MTRLTDEQITQKAREGYATDNGWSNAGRRDVLAGRYDHTEALKRIHAAIIATLTEYAPHLLPRDPDEELAHRLTEEFKRTPCDDLKPGQNWDMRLALYVIKHLDKERGK